MIWVRHNSEGHGGGREAEERVEARVEARMEVRIKVGTHRGN